MTLTPSQVMARAGIPESVEKDKDKVRDYLKEKLYERVIFVWKKSALDQGGMFHITGEDWQEAGQRNDVGARLLTFTYHPPRSRQASPRNPPAAFH